MPHRYEGTIKKAVEYQQKLTEIEHSIEALHQAFFNASDHLSDFYDDDEHANDAMKGDCLA